MDVLAAHAARHPDKPALVGGERVWTWAELIGRRNRLGHGLLALGLPPGGHVIVYAENSLEHYLGGSAARAAHDVFPRDAAGKLLKRQLREPYWAGRAARV
jgi:acyl-CoA synthetase (AMP-forming)/AMP-acid ligase II